MLLLELAAVALFATAAYLLRNTPHPTETLWSYDDGTSRADRRGDHRRQQVVG